MKKMPFYGYIKKGVFVFRKRKLFDAYCKLQRDGDYTVDLYKTKQSEKTREQLGYYYAVIVPTVFKQMQRDGNDSILICIKSQEDGEPHKYKEIAMTEDTIDNMLKQVWANANGVEVKSKADMTLEECSSLIDISIRWSAQYLGCNIPPPEERS